MGNCTLDTAVVNVSPASYVGTSEFTVPVTMSSSYATGGDTCDFTVSPLLATAVYHVAIDGVKGIYKVGAINYLSGGNAGKAKVPLIDTTTGLEISAGTDLSDSGAKVTFRARVLAAVNTV